jgi:hypothetical protein
LENDLGDATGSHGGVGRALLCIAELSVTSGPQSRDLGGKVIDDQPFEDGDYLAQRSLRTANSHFGQGSGGIGLACPAIRQVHGMSLTPQLAAA